MRFHLLAAFSLLVCSFGSLAFAQAKAGAAAPAQDAGWLAAVSYRTYAGGVPWKE